VTDHAILVDDERSACGHGAKADEVREKHAVGVRSLLVEVAHERDVDVLFFSPGFLRKWTVHADAHDGVIRHSEQTPTPKELPDFNKIAEVLASL
jgi:hypothetical protein